MLKRQTEHWSEKLKEAVSFLVATVVVGSLGLCWITNPARFFFYVKETVIAVAVLALVICCVAIFLILTVTIHQVLFGKE